MYNVIYYNNNIMIIEKRVESYSLFCCWISEYVEHSEHLSNNGTIAERVADGSEPSRHLYCKEITIINRIIVGSVVKNLNSHCKNL